MKNGIPQLPSLYFRGSTFFILHTLPLFLVCFYGHNPQQEGWKTVIEGLRGLLGLSVMNTLMNHCFNCAESQAESQKLVLLLQTQTGCIYQNEKGHDTCPETPTLHRHQKHIIPNNTDQLWEYHLGFRISNLPKYRHLHSLEWAYSPGKILQVIPQSLLSKLGQGYYDG